jgi:prepilin-type N-terminal cleavage/methylation domain-containing protein
MRMKIFDARLKNSSGFTLVELLVVILILGVLSAIAVPLYLGQRTKAMITEADSNLEILRLLEEQYFAENGRYAPDPNGTAYYNSTATTIQDDMPGFRPGDVSSLKFDYEVESSTTTDDGDTFVARARGKSNTAVDGLCFQLDNSNIYNSCSP